MGRITWQKKAKKIKKLKSHQDKPSSDQSTPHGLLISLKQSHVPSSPGRHTNSCPLCDCREIEEHFWCVLAVCHPSKWQWEQVSIYPLSSYYKKKKSYNLYCVSPFFLVDITAEMYTWDKSILHEQSESKCFNALRCKCCRDSVRCTEKATVKWSLTSGTLKRRLDSAGPDWGFSWGYNMN